MSALGLRRATQCTMLIHQEFLLSRHEPHPFQDLVVGALIGVRRLSYTVTQALREKGFSGRTWDFDWAQGTRKSVRQFLQRASRALEDHNRRRAIAEARLC